MKVLLVGAGALGSWLAVEIAKRAKANTIANFELQIWDDDVVAERNVYSQNFKPSDIGLSKADTIARHCEEYVYCSARRERVNRDSSQFRSAVTADTIIIDATDSVKSRIELWYLGLYTSVPVLHLGMSQSGSGFISWNFGSSDTSQFSPANVDPDKLAELQAAPGPDSLPPCMLNRFNSLIGNTVQAALNALFVFAGYDVEGYLDVIWEGETQYPGYLTIWHTTTTSINLDGPLTSVGGEWPIKQSITQEK